MSVNDLIFLIAKAAEVKFIRQPIDMRSLDMESMVIPRKSIEST